MCKKQEIKRRKLAGKFNHITKILQKIENI